MILVQSEVYIPCMVALRAALLAPFPVAYIKNVSRPILFKSTFNFHVNTKGRSVDRPAERKYNEKEVISFCPMS